MINPTPQQTKMLLVTNGFFNAEIVVTPVRTIIRVSGYKSEIKAIIKLSYPNNDLYYSDNEYDSIVQISF